MAEGIASEALRDVQRRREEREAVGQEGPSDWDLVEEAVAKKDWEVVRWVLRQGAIRDVDKRRGSDEKTLLHDASYEGDLETVKMLSQVMGADMGAEDVGGWTPLHCAASANAADGESVHVLRFLLTEGGNVDVMCKDGYGNLPLHVGAHSLPVVQCLVEEFGAAVEAENDCCATPLLCAARGGDVSCLRYLLGRGALLDATTDSSQGVLHFAVQAESGDALRFLVEECGCDPSALEERQKGRLLEVAASSKSQERLQYLVEECGCDPSVWDETTKGRLLEAAARAKSHECLHYLVAECGLSFGACQMGTALLLAVSAGAMAVAEYLVQHHGVNPDQADGDGRRPLHEAVKGHHLSMVKWLVQQCSVDVNALGELGGTALHVAAWERDLECAKYLVEADADVLLPDIRGKRPSQLDADFFDDDSKLAALKAFLQEAEEMAQMQKNPE